MAYIIGRVWFTDRNGTVGIIATDNQQAFIGICIPGNTEQEDMRDIADWGASFPYKNAIYLINEYGYMGN